MSVGIRLENFKITICPKSDNKFNHFEFLVKDLDKYYHLNVKKFHFSKTHPCYRPLKLTKK